MHVASLSIDGFRSIRSGTFRLRPRSILIGPNGCGKSTIIDALSLVLGRARMVRPLTEHDFTGGNPAPIDRIRIVATITGFTPEDPDVHGDWFRMGRGVPKWLDADGQLHTTADTGRQLAAQLGFAARFDHTDLTVEAVRYFHDDDDATDPLADDTLQQVPGRLLNDIGYFVLPARRSWEGVTSFNSELFRRTVSDAAGIPASEILSQRDQLRSPDQPLEDSPALAELVTRLNQQLSRLLVQRPRFQLRVTAGDSEAVLQALLPHYAAGGTSLPASRQGMGLVSLQSLLLLLELGRSLKKKKRSFLLSLEEPELHLSPGLQVRLISEARRFADQIVCTTHSPRAAGILNATEIFVVNASPAGSTTATPLLNTPLPTTASNDERKLFIQNRPRLVEALMHPTVLVPEGRFDCEWLARIADAAEPMQAAAPFTTVYGIAPTENAAVAFTCSRLLALRPTVLALVDGDSAGDSYVAEVSALSPAPGAVIQWPPGWTIEDVVAWIVEAGGPDVLNAISGDLALDGWQVTSMPQLTTLLKTSNDRRQNIVGLKEDVVAHDLVVSAFRQSEACLTRAAQVCDALVQVALMRPHQRISREPNTSGVPRYRFSES